MGPKWFLILIRKSSLATKLWWWGIGVDKIQGILKEKATEKKFSMTGAQKVRIKGSSGMRF